MKNNESPPVPGTLINELYVAFTQLTSTCAEVKQAIIIDADEYAVYVPTHSDREKERSTRSAREQARHSMTQLFNDKTDVNHAGILCASPATVSTIEAFNNAKDHFKGTVLAIRDFCQSSDRGNKTVKQLIKDGYRAGELKNALVTTQASSLDLVKCYRNIRVLEKNLDSFSWTWDTNHNRIQKLPVSEVEKLIDKLPESMIDAKETALGLLKSCSTDEILLKKSKLPNQLRANFTYLVDGEIERTNCPISGVVVAQQKHLPRIAWPSHPSEDGRSERRLPRRSTIESTPFIQCLNIYRYAK